jgi:LSD1 subclass zinc finger protein
VRCSLCAAVTAVPAATAQLDCGGCGTRLAYQAGASSVRCAVCATVNVAAGGGPAHCRCGGCGLTLAHQSNAHSVRCANCQHVTCVNGVGVASSADPFATIKASNMVVVENPPTLDPNGKPRSNMAVGVVCE